MNSYRAAAFKAYPNECNECGHLGSKDNRLEVHHRDEDRANNDITNLQILCHQCHLLKHPGTGVTVVSMSFTDPLSLAQWLQEYMRRKKVGRSEAVMAGLELLREQTEQERTAA